VNHRSDANSGNKDSKGRGNGSTELSLRGKQDPPGRKPIALKRAREERNVKTNPLLCFEAEGKISVYAEKGENCCNYFYITLLKVQRSPAGRGSKAQNGTRANNKKGREREIFLSQLL